MIKDRLRKIREEMKLSQAKMAKELELNQATYARYETGNISCPDSLKEQLAIKYNINLNWLICGDGDMYTNSIYSTEEVYPSYVSEKGRELYIKDDIDGVEVTVYKQPDSVSKGKDWINDIGSSYVIKLSKDFIKNYKEVYGAVVRGDSMQDIFLFDNDIVFFTKTITSVDGIYVLTIDNELCVKKLEFEPISRVLRIISYNENFKPQEVNIDDDRVTILGKVIGWLHGV